MEKTKALQEKSKDNRAGYWLLKVFHSTSIYIRHKKENQQGLLIGPSWRQERPCTLVCSDQLSTGIYFSVIIIYPVFASYLVRFEQSICEILTKKNAKQTITLHKINRNRHCVSKYVSIYYIAYMFELCPVYIHFWWHCSEKKMS